jgi:hypothetical protein
MRKGTHFARQRRKRIVATDEDIVIIMVGSVVGRETSLRLDGSMTELVGLCHGVVGRSGLGCCRVLPRCVYRLPVAYRSGTPPYDQPMSLLLTTPDNDPLFFVCERMMNGDVVWRM